MCGRWRVASDCRQNCILPLAFVLSPHQLSGRSRRLVVSMRRRRDLETKFANCVLNRALSQNAEWKSSPLSRIVDKNTLCKCTRCIVGPPRLDQVGSTHLRVSSPLLCATALRSALEGEAVWCSEICRCRAVLPREVRVLETGCSTSHDSCLPAV